MVRFLVRLLLFFAFIAALAVAGFGWWAMRPLALTTERADFTVVPGAGLRHIAHELNQAGVPTQPELFVALARLTELDTRIKAGGYEVTPNDSMWKLLQRMAQGDVTHARITFIEGWTYQQIRQELRRHPDIRQTLDKASDQELLERLELKAMRPEGLFFPDTYSFAKGSTDFEILRRAAIAMQQQLALAWDLRQPELPLASPYELLIMASIIEKETGHEAERARISGVFANRLRVNMPLQTDPTVIYGMGENFDGTIRRRDLQTDTPWNTYMRRGLPPTPIASPGRRSLLAAAQPESHRYYYFVSRGDGTSEFSPDLATHNRHVSRYLRGGH